MSEEKRPDEKVYTNLSAEFIRDAGESVGIWEMSEDIAESLADDSSYRIREILTAASQFMKHSKRRKLHCKDINKALKWMNIQPLYGFECTGEKPEAEDGDSETPVFRFVGEASAFVEPDEDIDFSVEDLDSDSFKCPPPINVYAQWLAIEGLPNKNHSPYHSSKVGQLNVSDDLNNYYTEITKAILSSNGELSKIAIADLRTNNRISSLLPYLINFVSTGLKKLSHDLSQLTKLLDTVEALVTNEYLYLGAKPYLNLLMLALLYCILEPLTASLNPINDHWKFRRHAARVLCLMLKHWHTSTNQLKDHVIAALEDGFTDLTRPFYAHYGALITIGDLGIKELNKIVLCNLSTYSAHLLQVIDDSSQNYQIRFDSYKVYEILMLLTELILKRFYKSLSSFETAKNVKIRNSINFAYLYQQASDLFGDSLYARLPFFFKVYAARDNVPPISAFLKPENTKTGEELLAELMAGVKTEKVDTESISDYYTCIEMPEVAERGSVNLRIKSTINEPGRGIKLTISKVHEQQRFRTKMSLHSVFENYCLVVTGKKFEFDLPGNSYLSSQRMRYATHNEFVEIRTHQLGLRMKRVGRRMGKLDRGERNTRSFVTSLLSCSLYSVI